MLARGRKRVSRGAMTQETLIILFDLTGTFAFATAKEIPMVPHADFYATAALLGAVVRPSPLRGFFVPRRFLFALSRRRMRGTDRKTLTRAPIPDRGGGAGIFSDSRARPVFSVPEAAARQVPSC